MNENRKLYRSRNDRVFFGVCGGLAEYFDIDPTIVRLVTVIIAVWGGVGVLAYLVAALIIPEEPEGNLRHAKGGDKSQEKDMASKKDFGKKMEAAAQQIKTEVTKEPGKGQWIGGLILIAFGVLFLINQFVPSLDFGKLWPVILIVIGASIIANNTRR